jgi:Bacterial Ig-like domain (group 3)
VDEGDASEVQVQVSSLPKPTGTVELRHEGNLLATEDLADGDATLTMPARELPPGTHRADVRYLGNDDVAPSATDVDLVVRPASSGGNPGGPTDQTSGQAPGLGAAPAPSQASGQPSGRGRGPRCKRAPKKHTRAAKRKSCRPKGGKR